MIWRRQLAAAIGLALPAQRTNETRRSILPQLDLVTVFITEQVSAYRGLPVNNRAVTMRLSTPYSPLICFGPRMDVTSSRT